MVKETTRYKNLKYSVKLETTVQKKPGALGNAAVSFRRVSQEREVQEGHISQRFHHMGHSEVLEWLCDDRKPRRTDNVDNEEGWRADVDPQVLPCFVQ